ncbi:unnamed protein product [Cyprideis torosa]|uniref:Aminoacyl-transfer RNA synthetases class-II family profile domain-containing protein n=1 Tax=Cyprideis torosa TaxID=163714 RepID=A0A7R8WSC7_9CRUS|nr:unnamed protein product [Cyprideis torosa]CAG0909358.1 unnamed protein product [Cyprideis torosa]
MVFDWQPSASMEALQKRARLLQDVRAFFYARHFLEVDTPIMSSAGTTDPSIESVRVTGPDAAPRFLHTSPEFAMKRLLAAGSGDIFQVAKVFREGEAGRFHNPEFTLLEWYRLGMDHHDLMEEVVGLILHLAGDAADTLSVEKVSYRDLCRQALAIDPLIASVSELHQIAVKAGLDIRFELDRDGWLDLLLSHMVMPSLPAGQLTLLFDYPASQAALSRINDDGLTAARFEVFWGGTELANGFFELQDADEQRERFFADNVKRAEAGQLSVPMDDHLIAALEAGLPECSGVALGLDRLLMKLTGRRDIQEILAFPFCNA